MNNAVFTKEFVKIINETDIHSDESCQQGRQRMANLLGVPYKYLFGESSENRTEEEKKKDEHFVEKYNELFSLESLLVSEKYVKMRKLYAYVEEFMEKHEISCAESCYQVDSIREEAEEFMDKCCEIVGYPESEEEE